MSESGKDIASEQKDRHSLRTSAIICAALQILATLSISVIMAFFTGTTRASLVAILTGINILACIVAICFLFLCISKRKFGRNYDLILHSYLLSMLAEGLASLFALLYYPLLLLQNLNHWRTQEIVQAGMMTGIGGLMLGYQLFQRHIVEDMLTYMEYNFK